MIVERYKKHCHILEVNFDASLLEIKLSYKRLLKIHHPDVSVHPNAKTKTIELITAYKEIFKLRDEVVQILYAKKQQESEFKKSTNYSGNYPSYDDFAMSAKEYIKTRRK